VLVPLLAALALSATLEAEVPFLPQTPDLCGGAAAAMVFRYWGDAQADVQQFAPLVDRKAGGIAQTALVAAVRERGWQAAAFTGSVDALRDHLEHRRPIIVLLHDRGRRYHYVVVTAVDSAGVTVHDPSRGPSRLIRSDEFERRWKATRFWSLVIVPQNKSDVGSALRRTSEVRLKPDATYCDGRLDDAIVEVQERGLHEADAILGRVRAECPASAGPLRELAGVRFAERQWNDSAALSRQALAIDPNDRYAIDVLGSSLFMLDDPTGALRAWNRIGRPRFDTVRIEGLHHTRYDAVAAAVAPPPHALLTAETFALAARRLNELPDRSSAHLTLRPEADGSAMLDAAIAERQTLPRGIASWTGSGVRAAVDREAGVSIPGFTGQGDVWSASWRWWEHRPRVAFGVRRPASEGCPACGASTPVGNEKRIASERSSRPLCSCSRMRTAASPQAIGSRRIFGIQSAAASTRGTRSGRLRRLAARSSGGCSATACRWEPTRPRGCPSVVAARSPPSARASRRPPSHAVARGVARAGPTPRESARNA
jgi:hypothetical protein